MEPLSGSSIQQTSANNAGTSSSPVGVSQSTETSVGVSSTSVNGNQQIATSQQTEGPSENKPKSKVLLYSIIGIVGVTLLVTLSFFGVRLLSNKNNGNTSSSKTSGLLSNIGNDLSKYDKDTDKDGYPDFIETEVGLDPNVSEYDTCKKDNCADSNLQTTTATHNVLIILDASGSMGTGGTPNRMDTAKQAIKNYVSKAAASAQIGLMIYGHKGSNSTADKATSCASAEVISQIGQTNLQNVDSQLSVVRPVGWTPMGLAIEQAQSAFTGKEGQNNEIILLSDGEETCDTNPTQKAAQVKASALNIKINVIGFAVDANAQTQLNQISTSGGGTFAVANNLTDLDRRFVDLYENSKKLYAENKCKLQDVETFRACYLGSYNKIYDWITKRKLTFFDKKISKEEYNKLDELGSAIFKQQSEITNKETQNTVNELQQKWQQQRQ